MKHFLPYRFYYFPQNTELLYQVVGTTKLGLAATTWRRGFAGRPYMISHEVTLLTQDMRPDMLELGARHIEPRTEAGYMADLIMNRQHWYVQGPTHGTA
jgi:hypothetical protein